MQRFDGRNLERSNILIFTRNQGELNPLCPADLKAGQGVSHSDEHRGGGRDENSQTSR
jgi:hypothetical protein